MAKVISKAIPAGPTEANQPKDDPLGEPHQCCQTQRRGRCNNPQGLYNHSADSNRNRYANHTS